MKAKIAYLKKEIKFESWAQTTEKKLLRKPHSEVPGASTLQSKCHYRAQKISTLLNLYHELRGKEFRHPCKADYPGSYTRSKILAELDKIKEELALVEDAKIYA